MKPRTYRVLERAVEEGVAYGYSRAHKHSDRPNATQLTQEIARAVLAAIDEVFDFDELSDKVGQ